MKTQKVLLKGLRTLDISNNLYSSKETIVSTQEMGQAVIDQLTILSGK